MQEVTFVIPTEINHQVGEGRLIKNHFDLVQISMSVLEKS